MAVGRPITHTAHFRDRSRRSIGFSYEVRPTSRLLPWSTLPDWRAKYCEGQQTSQPHFAKCSHLVGDKVSPRVETANMMLDWTVWPLATYTGKFENHQRYIGVTLVSRCDRFAWRVPRRAAASRQQGLTTLGKVTHDPDSSCFIQHVDTQHVDTH